MAVVFRNASQLVGTGTQAAVAEPSGAAQGDVLIGLVEVDNAAVSAPAGWSTLVTGVSVGTTRYRADWIVRGASAPDLTWTFAGNVFREVDVICLRSDISATITLDSVSASGSTSTAGGQPDSPLTAAVATTSLAISGGCQNGGAGTVGLPAGYTLRSLNTVTVDCAMASKALSASGNEDPAAFSGFAGGSHDLWNGFTATFTDASAADTLMAQACL